MQGHPFKYGVLHDLARMRPPSDSVTVEIRCACGERAEFAVAIVAVHDEPEVVDPNWDGVVLPHVIVCSRCGAEDAYAVEPRVAARLRTRARSRRAGDPVSLAELRSWDGSVMQRPARQLAHLRALAEALPSSGQAWRRYGNVLEKLGKSEAAEAAWRRAVEVDENEFPAAAALAQRAYREQRDDAWSWIDGAFERLRGRRFSSASQDASAAASSGNADAEAAERESSVGELLSLLEEHVQWQPLGMTVAWVADGKKHIVVTISKLDLRAVRRWDRLRALLSSERLSGAHLCDPPSADEESSVLQTVLESELPLGVLQDLALSEVARAETGVCRAEPATVWRSRSKKRKSKRGARAARAISRP